MAHATPKPWSVEEFLAWERAQEERYEFVDGIVRLMVGGTADHNTITGNVFATLRARLRGGPCRAFMSDMKVQTDGAVMYPDVVVTCAGVPPKGDTVPEPRVVVEVLSRSTESFDRGSKWTAYQRVPSLDQYVLVSQDRLRVEVYTRRDRGWAFEVLTEPAEVVRFPSLSVEVTIAEIYESTSLEPQGAMAG
jgi:Uma2 family endonuclease